MTERSSVALRHVMDRLAGRPGSPVLDLGGASQGAVDHLAAAGHQLFTEDLLRALAAAPGVSPEAFLAAHLAHAPAHFDAVLCWDALAYAPPALLGPLVARVHEVLRSGGLALAFFPGSPAAAAAPPGRFEIRGLGLVRRKASAATGLAARFRTRRELDLLLGERFSITDVLTPDGFHEMLLVKKSSPLAAGA